jgi:ATP-dependent RNA helicase DDX3X
VVVYGGTGVREQANTLMDGVDILIGTPGRMHDFIERGQISLRQTRYVAIDEADRMLDMGFMPQLKKIILTSDMPSKRETSMYSATFPKEIRQLAEEFMSNYVFLQIGRVGSTNEFITQKFVQVDDIDKQDALKRTLQTMARERPKVLVFVEMKRTATSLENSLLDNNFPACSIHGDKQQFAREKALSIFKKGEKPILVATDVAARGLDIPDVSYVINYDCPKNIDDYVHRIGRTGRCGKAGTAITFLNSRSGAIVPKLLKLLREAKQEVP